MFSSEIYVSRKEDVSWGWNKAKEKFIYSDIVPRLQLAARVCPNVLKTWGIAKENGSVDIYYELFPNPTRLDSWILELKKKEENAPLLETVFVISETVISLHRFGIVHRDINPSNFLVDASGAEPAKTIKLIDFELANFIGSQNSDFGIPAGTGDYAPYEQFKVGTILDQAVDQYSLALTLAFILTNGEFGPRFSAFSDEEMCKAMTEKFNQKIADIFSKATNYSPEERYQSVLQFRCALVAALAKFYRSKDA